MTDRELLQFAAKAAGLPVIFEDDGVPCEPYLLTYGGSWSENWNPLEDDGDALRLAIELRMCVSIGDAGLVQAQVWADQLLEHDLVCASEEIYSDIAAVTRRAITRAAAEIGKAVP